MDFYLEFHLSASVSHSFREGEYKPIELFDDEPTPVHADILSDADRKIGKLSGFLLWNEKDFHDRCDAESGDCEVIASAICKKDGSVSSRYIAEENRYDQIFILDKIGIEKKYRNQGIASAIMEKLPQILRYQFDYAGGTIFLCASDFGAAREYGFDSPQYRSGTERLKHFYKKFGYKMVKDNVMVYNGK